MTLTPQTARSDEEMAQLKRDSLDIRDHWIVVDASKVTLAKQRVHEAPTEQIEIPKDIFDQFVKFYVEG
jgi:hypothetical protein